MKIAYLLGSLNRGGTETLLLDIFRNADKADFEIIGIYRKEGLLSDDFKQTGCPFFRLYPKGKHCISYFFRLRKLLEKQSVQIIHAQQSIDVIYAFIASLFTGIKIVLTFHGFPSKTIKSKLINTIAIGCSDSVIFVSQYQKTVYQETYKLKESDKLRVVYNGISLDKLNDYTYSSIRKELNINEDVMLIGSVGNFVDVREPLTICRFLNLLKQQKTPFHFLFVGKKNEANPLIYDNCVNYCRENGFLNQVSFLGSRSDVPNILSQLDAFIYSTDHDTFGIAVIEAIMIGIPVFVNDWAVMKEIICQEELAILYKTKDEASLFRTFMLFLQNKNAYVNKSMQSSSLAKKFYSIEKHINELEKLYTNLLGPKLC